MTEEEWQSLPLGNNYIFTRMMEDPEICTETLRAILPIKVGEIEHNITERTIDVAWNKKSIRFDVYAKDEENVYNIEFQGKLKGNLMKRARFYLSILDIDSIEKGIEYDLLPNSYVIFVCDFDLLEKNKAIYTGRFQFDGDDNDRWNIGSNIVFVNGMATDFAGNETLKALVQYLHGVESEHPMIRKMMKRMIYIKSNMKWRKEYMTIMLEERYLREEGREEGRLEGIEEGRLEGIEEGRLGGIEEGIEKNKLTTASKMLASMTDEVIASFTELSLEQVAQLRREQG